jgi:hypothetical protein
MKLTIIPAVALLIVMIVGCQGNPSKVDQNTSRSIDKEKRNHLVEKYDLLNFSKAKKPVLLSIDEFFDGNLDNASIAPNLDKKESINVYYKILKELAENPQTIDAFVEIKDVITYDDGQLYDNEWFYTDKVYFIGDLTKEEIKEATLILQPDDVDYEQESRIANINEKYKDKKVVYVWWD